MARKEPGLNIARYKREREREIRNGESLPSSIVKALSLFLSLSLCFVFNDPSMLEICLRLQPRSSSNQFELPGTSRPFVFNLSIKKKNADPR